MKLIHSTECRLCRKVLGNERKGKLIGQLMVNENVYDVEIHFCQICFLSIVESMPRIVVKDITNDRQSVQVQ